MGISGPHHPSHRPTLAEVAALAGVSHQTVSRVVNDFPGVKPSTRDRVQAAIAELGYRRNTAARSLVTNESRLVGVIAVGSFLYGPTSTLAAIEDAAREHGYMTLLATVKNTDGANLGAAVNECLERSVDALIIIANQEMWVRYSSTLDVDVPLIVVGPRPNDIGSLTCMSVNQAHGAEMAIDHLDFLGHRKIGILAGPRDWVDAQQRLSGALTACYKKGIESEVREGDWSAKQGYETGLELLELPAHDRPTAIFAANDLMALGLLAAFNQQGLSVPDDISVMGFDDVPGAEFYSPPLTTIRQDFTTLGRKVLAACLDLINGNEPDVELVKPILRVRASTSAPRSPQS